MIDDNFIRDRITKLRMKRNISEYKMSLDMGHSASYIHSIASGKAMPSMGEFLYMCDYLGVTPSEFFDDGVSAPLSLKALIDAADGLPEEDIEILTSVADRLAKKKK